MKKLLFFVIAILSLNAQAAVDDARLELIHSLASTFGADRSGNYTFAGEGCLVTYTSGNPAHPSAQVCVQLDSDPSDSGLCFDIYSSDRGSHSPGNDFDGTRLVEYRRYQGGAIEVTVLRQLRSSNPRVSETYTRFLRISKTENSKTDIFISNDKNSAGFSCRGLL
jgi:hypothetical protein